MSICGGGCGSDTCPPCFARTLPAFFAGCWQAYPCECQAGWFPIIRRLAAVKPPGVVITQVKEKFGGLRVYYDGGSNGDAWDLAVREAEATSFKTCEVCGSPGEPSGGGWIRTRCEAHR